MSRRDRRFLHCLRLAVSSGLLSSLGSTLLWGWSGSDRAIASSVSISQDGINAAQLHAAPYRLLGSKIAIGQVEIGRPAIFGLDKIPASLEVSPAGVFFRDGIAQSDLNLDGHAQGVASVMVSNLKARQGVAPGARLYSAGAALEDGIARQEQECLTTQNVALQNGGDVRSINFSFGEPLALDVRRQAAVLDGNALLTQCIDWSANAHNVLYVIAGNQGYGGISIPTDHYNGITVASSRMIDGVYRQIDPSSLGSVFEGGFSTLIGQETNINGRLLIGLLAPGRDVSLVSATGQVYDSTGTSFAAPHVTATVALLQEYGDREILAGRWNTDSRRHEVTRAILFNSADKLADRGDGLALGMTRNVLDKQGNTWLESVSYTDPTVPLQRDVGAGHLNAYRAYQQMAGGRWSPGKAVGAIGWDYNTVRQRSYQDYAIDQPLKANSFVSATLSWTRQVNLNDVNENGKYDEGETFDDRGLNNLDLYLLPAESDRLEDAVWSSRSPVDSTEHIFHKIPQTGRYKLRVVFQSQVNDREQTYALAWWGVP